MRHVPEPRPAAYELAQAAYALHAALEAQLHDTLEALDLTMPLSDALWQLDPARCPMPRRALADRLRCDPSNITFLADRLQQRRLLTRARDDNDRRVQTLTLTPAGIQARQRLIQAIAESSIFSDLTAAEQRQLTNLLHRCVPPAGELLT